LVVAACLLALGVVFAVVGTWADRKIRQGDSRVQASAASDVFFADGKLNPQQGRRPA
jgi:hypothetical protein